MSFAVQDYKVMFQSSNGFLAERNETLKMYFGCPINIETKALFRLLEMLRATSWATYVYFQ